MTVPRPPAHAAEPPETPRWQTTTLVVLLVLVVLALAAVVVLLLRDDGDDVTAGSTTTSGPSTTTGETTTTIPPDDPGAPPGHIDPAAPPEAPAVAAIRHGNHDGFERIAVDFDGPLPPRTRLEPLLESGIVRVVLHTPTPTSAVGVATAFVDSELVRSAWFVSDGTTSWVDVHVTPAVEPVVFRLGEQQDSEGNVKGIVVIDLVPADGDVGEVAASEGGVILTPAPGATVPLGDLPVEGYGDRFEGAGILRLVDQDGVVVVEEFTQAPGGPVNGFFSVTLDLSDVDPGEYLLLFTEEDASGGEGRPPRDVTVPLTVE